MGEPNDFSSGGYKTWKVLLIGFVVAFFGACAVAIIVYYFRRWRDRRAARARAAVEAVAAAAQQIAEAEAVEATTLFIDTLNQLTFLSVGGIFDEDGVDTPECAICILEYDNEDEIVCLGCGHSFHKHCIKSWLHRNKDCPVCRYEQRP